MGKSGDMTALARAVGIPGAVMMGLASILGTAIAAGLLWHLVARRLAASDTPRA